MQWCNSMDVEYVWIQPQVCNKQRQQHSIQDATHLVDKQFTNYDI